jgi:two-component system, chemotaxis family, sensor kinase CheA
MDNNDDILAEFIIEAREILDQLDLDFVQLEETPDDKKLVGNIFRAMHTLKGSSGFFAFKRLEKVSHAGESLLGKIRDGHLALDTQKTSTLLMALDALREIISGIEVANTEPAGDDALLIADLLSLANGGEVSSNNNRGAIPSPQPSTPPLETTQTTEDLVLDAIESEDIEATDEALMGDSLVATDTEMAVDAAAPTGNARTTEVAAPVKVNLELLDKLMNLVSEMVLARNRLLPFTAEFGDHNFSNTVRSIDLLTLELQERMMKTRMQPISQVWAKFPRLVRDIANDCHKKVTLIQEGAETELDRTLLDGIRDPLIHIIRNSVDHGIELPAERLAKGKPENGKVLLRAIHENGMVVIEIADDGGGIKFDAVRQKAVDKKLVSFEDAKKLSDIQLLEFIFLPGFSTNQVVTNLSGRGVGMDVVKNNISAIGGSIEIDSHRGKGTNIRLKIPLTLAIMPALFVRCENERYAIPQNSISEMVRIDPNNSTGLEDFYGTPVFRLRGKLVPLLFLNQQLKLSEHSPDSTKAINVAILQSSGISFGLVVDEVLNMQEVVVKPLGALLKGIPDFAGATILGDGRVALILDVDGMAIHSGLVAKIQARPLNPETVFDQVREEEVSMLLFELAGLERIAIPLDNVERLENFALSRVQRNGSREVVQYGDHIMHLIRMNDYIEGGQPSVDSPTQPLSVIVHYVNQMPIGLVVSQVHDIIHVPKKLQAANPPQRGLAGCVLMGEKVINVVDLQEILMMRNLQEHQKTYPEVIDMDVLR